MQFDPDNNVIKLCARGMGLEGEGKNEEAYIMFQQAWNEATDDFEKFTAAQQKLSNICFSCGTR